MARAFGVETHWSRASKQRAVEILERGGVIAYPTDTTYGIGCSIFDKHALDRIYLLKGLKRDHLLGAEGEQGGLLGGQRQRLVASVAVQRLRAAEHGGQRL